MLLQCTIRAARLVERVTTAGGRNQWVRAAVDWTPEVAALLAAGLLTLGPAPASPQQRRPQSAAERARRYRARQRGQPG